MNIVLVVFLLLPVALVWALTRFARRLRTSGRAATWQQIIAGNLLVLVLLISVGTLGGEIYFRFFCDETDSLNYTMLSARWIHRHWKTNATGSRDNIQYTTQITAGKRRITFVGDSFTAGHGVPDIENRFANLVRKAHPEWEIHTLAQPGFDTYEEKNYLDAAMGDGYKIDEVVLVYCLNDVSDLLPEHEEVTARVRKEIDDAGWIYRNSFLFSVLRYRLKVMTDPAMRTYFPYVLEAYRGPTWNLQKQRLQEFRELVESHGGRLSVVIFPFFHALGPNYDFQFVHDEMDQFWKEQKVPCLDLLTVYQGIPSSKLVVNRYDAHPNEYAHALAARAIDEFMLKQMAQKR